MLVNSSLIASMHVCETPQVLVPKNQEVFLVLCVFYPSEMLYLIFFFSARVNKRSAVYHQLNQPSLHVVALAILETKRHGLLDGH